MADVVPYERATAAGSAAERRLLKSVEVSHYVWGGMVGVPFGLLFLLSLATLPFHGMANEPGSSGLRVILRSLAFCAPVAVTGLLTFWSGRCIARRRRRRFSLIWSAAWAGAGLVGVAYELTTVAAMRRMRFSAVHERGPLTLAVVFGAGVALAVFSYTVLRRNSTAGIYASTAEGPL